MLPTLAQTELKVKTEMELTTPPAPLSSGQLITYSWIRKKKDLKAFLFLFVYKFRRHAYGKKEWEPQVCSKLDRKDQ